MQQPSTNADDYQDVPRPVAAMAKEYPDGFVVKPHSHIRSQLLYATAGAMRVSAAGSSWTVPPQRAIWIPAGIRHELRMVGPVKMRTLYIRPAYAPWTGPACKVIEVSGLLRELILSALEEPPACEEGSRGDLINRLILSELNKAEHIPIRVPMPQDPRLLAICNFLLEHPESNDTIELWSERAGFSVRTIARRFQAETGLSFGEWRQQARIAEAVCRLSLGQSIKVIAFDLGYKSSSAFIAMFRKALGKAPQQYAANRSEP
jgi:AraC-like DNA-binding protein/mannose-6-phosphate isomerase-like protein (cupin superfamily)